MLANVANLTTNCDVKKLNMNDHELFLLLNNHHSETRLENHFFPILALFKLSLKLRMLKNVSNE
jgi:hypothetical protein